MFAFFSAVETEFWDSRSRQRVQTQMSSTIRAYTVYDSFYIFTRNKNVWF